MRSVFNIAIGADSADLQRTARSALLQMLNTVVKRIAMATVVRASSLPAIPLSSLLPRLQHLTSIHQHAQILAPSWTEALPEKHPHVCVTYTVFFPEASLQLDVSVLRPCLFGPGQQGRLFGNRTAFPSSTAAPLWQRCLCSFGRNSSAVRGGICRC